MPYFHVASFIEIIVIINVFHLTLPLGVSTGLPYNAFVCWAQKAISVAYFAGLICLLCI